MIIGNKEFDLYNKTYIMGIMNVTPDSFSDGGKNTQKSDALKNAEQMIADGVDIIDIGGESTRPGYEHISIDEEISRVVPVIEAIKAEFDIPVSIDTYHAKCAEAACLAGADLINDIWGLQRDPDMASVVAKLNLPYCLMHNRNTTEYHEGFLEGVCKDIDRSLAIAKTAGIDKEKIILDPGIGFGKDYTQNLLMLKHLDILKKYDMPVLLGVSRKSVIGNTLNLPVNEREEGTQALSVWGAIHGCGIVRVHDVRGNKRAVKMIEAVKNV